MREYSIFALYVCFAVFSGGRLNTAARWRFVWAGKDDCHKNRTRSSHRAWGATAPDKKCIHRTTGSGPWAFLLFWRPRSVGRSAYWYNASSHCPVEGAMRAAKHLFKGPLHDFLDQFATPRAIKQLGGKGRGALARSLGLTSPYPTESAGQPLAGIATETPRRLSERFICFANTHPPRALIRSEKAWGDIQNHFAPSRGESFDPPPCAELPQSDRLC